MASGLRRGALWAGLLSVCLLAARQAGAISHTQRVLLHPVHGPKLAKHGLELTRKAGIKWRDVPSLMRLGKDLGKKAKGMVVPNQPGNWGHSWGSIDMLLDRSFEEGKSLFDRAMAHVQKINVERHRKAFRALSQAAVNVQALAAKIDEIAKDRSFW